MALSILQVRDEKGRKMSKSLGNVVDPVDVLKTSSCDALRLTLATGTLPLIGSTLCSIVLTALTVFFGRHAKFSTS